MKRFLLTSTALIFALQTGVADAEEMVVRQAQLIDFARPLPQKENIPAVENDMRNQFAAIAPEEMNRDPARLRLGRIKYLRPSRGAPRAPTHTQSPPLGISDRFAAGDCAVKPYRPSPILGQRADRRRELLYPLVRRAACEARLPVGLIDALIMQESRYNPSALSPKGAFGLGQLMPATARQLGVDRYDLMQNLTGTAMYLAQQLDEFGRVDFALAAYNAGPGRVRSVRRIPRIAETQNYVRQIMANWRSIEAGGAIPNQPSIVRAAGILSFLSAPQLVQSHSMSGRSTEFSEGT
ncbi:hypothetical protein SKP52_23775 (plasmid) [Sphingopyxis fribergensis]|jgi:soluble lytic murein transglycosylase-like protein|uniref:Transglycosylase SLT domain-containing protein n=2 Tax=Sphingopyxis TaxID=165697 RepID=A0A0A7PU27_9SPHN|nr:lytic transglycosylase domain-containing protein [Sphingopyxis fribergensis]AJA11597.1 hypothetical protein SKP52_23775 [Sphingopyxis fribergensis]KGB58494.1 Lytic transglycosylase, catalytic [Sphingopyxis sp. LC363]